MVVGISLLVLVVVLFLTRKAIWLRLENLWMVIKEARSGSCVDPDPDVAHHHPTRWTNS